MKPLAIVRGASASHQIALDDLRAKDRTKAGIETKIKGDRTGSNSLPRMDEPNPAPFNATSVGSQSTAPVMIANVMFMDLIILALEILQPFNFFFSDTQRVCSAAAGSGPLERWVGPLVA